MKRVRERDISGEALISRKATKWTDIDRHRERERGKEEKERERE